MFVPKLLFVDDEKIVLQSCLRVLSHSEYQIHTAHSGEEGLSLFEKNHYDLIITDLKMPGIGGIELLKRIKKKNPAQVVIVFTGFANVETARESLKLGGFDYIPKPFTPPELIEVIENALTHIKSKGKTPSLDLMAIVAHEFKSPVATMHTTVDTLYEGYFGHLNLEQRKVLESILRNCQYLEDIIRCFIDLSKIETDVSMENLLTRRQKIHLWRDVIQPVVETPEYQNNFKHMNLICQIEELPLILADPHLIKIVVNNLINNAIKYGFADTDIYVRARVEEKYLQLSVCNQGVGISDEDIKTKLFSKFGRLKQPGTEGAKGSGLGLYICKLVVQKHSGEMSVNSEINKYTDFIVRLPLDLTAN